MTMRVHRIIAWNYGDWGPDKLYGQSASPVFIDDADCRAALSRLEDDIDPAESPDGLEYAVETVDAADLTADEAAMLRPYDDKSHPECLAYAEWADAEIERLAALVAEIAALRADEHKQKVAELIRPVLGDRAATKAYRGEGLEDLGAAAADNEVA